MSKKVREPIQVYLDRDERSLLDRLAKETGLSRAEILRRGIKSFATNEMPVRSPVLDFLRSIAGDDWPATWEEAEREILDSYLDRHES